MPVVAAWAALALIHALPALALFAPALIERLYGVAPGSDVFLLLHHRAALFLVVVVLCLWAAARPEVRRLAAVAVGLSMVSFLALYAAGGMPRSLAVIAVADLVGLAPLGFAARHAFRRGGAVVRA
jgi:hypothetical protein